MLESLLMKKKVVTSGVSIAGAADSSTWTKTSGVTVGSDGSYTFAAGSLNTVRIPQSGTPYPVGEDMEIRLRGHVYSQPAGVALYFLGKWKTVSGQGELCMKRTSSGAVQFDVGPISETATQSTSGTIALDTDFELYWRRKGSTYYAELNGVNIFNATVAGQRQCATDYVLGSYIDSNNNVSTGAIAANWKLTYLAINRLTS